jgi:riboflavin kinase / FMN adenylyltransferase
MQKLFRFNSKTKENSFSKLISDAPLGVAIGNFDSLHLGHQELFSKLAEQLKDIEKITGLNSRKILVSFYPHPRKFFSRFKSSETGKDFQIVSSMEEKIELLTGFGFDYIFLIHFTSEIQQLSPEEFVKRFLVNILKAKVVCVGRDWRFGQAQKGDVALLTKLSGKHNFKVIEVGDLLYQKRRISTGYVKEVLESGDLDLLNKLLNYEYFVIGRVTSGNQRGKSFNLPTANIIVKNRKTLRRGVYVTQTRLKSKLYNSVTNVGINPTFSGNELRIETYLLNYQGEDFYREKIKVIFKKRVRDEIKFSSAELLLKQIAQDIKFAENYFSESND